VGWNVPANTDSVGYFQLPNNAKHNRSMRTAIAGCMIRTINAAHYQPFDMDPHTSNSHLHSAR
ncbi:hypothetical protein MMC08_009131, partial [Hypocenomyce scalaris]|nr:hypothetical protein [Hypocenomyce scalaris]